MGPLLLQDQRSEWSLKDLVGHRVTPREWPLHLQLQHPCWLYEYGRPSEDEVAGIEKLKNFDLPSRLFSNPVRSINNFTTSVI